MPRMRLCQRRRAVTAVEAAFILGLLFLIMLAILGNRRVADIYFTEFNRLFYHYYFRSIQEKTRNLSEDGETSPQ